MSHEIGSIATRIAELQRQIVTEWVTGAAKSPSLDFWLKVSGSTNEELIEARMEDPKTLCWAIVAYLEEQAIKDSK